MYNEQALDLETGQGFVTRATDPNVLPQPYVTPTGFSAMYPTPIETTEFYALCEETGLVQEFVDSQFNQALKEVSWRELNSLAFNSGSSYIAFADGECPEEYTQTGATTTVTLKNLGAKKSLSESDIMHSTAAAASGWNAISALLGGIPWGEGLPGSTDMSTFALESVADIKEVEMRRATTLVINGYDRLLAVGDATTNSLEFDGFENLITAANGSVVDTGTASGSFSAATFDRHLSSICAAATDVLGHPQAIQEMLSAYFQLGFQGSQLVNFDGGNRIVPGFSFASTIRTGIGDLKVVSDKNFTLSASGSTTMQSTLYSIRRVHNGTPLVYVATQIPLAIKDLAPGCTAVSFQVWTKAALIVKHKCAHAAYTSNFTGNIVTSCPTIG